MSELKELLKGQLPPDYLSASSLNAFVKYGEDGPETEGFHSKNRALQHAFERWLVEQDR